MLFFGYYNYFKIKAANKVKYLLDEDCYHIALKEKNISELIQFGNELIKSEHISFKLLTEMRSDSMKLKEEFSGFYGIDDYIKNLEQLIYDIQYGLGTPQI